MEKHKEIIEEICKGNGNSFKIKEILQAHIIEDRARFDNINGKVDGVIKRLSKGDVWFMKLQTHVKLQWGIVLAIIGVIISRII